MQKKVKSLFPPPTLMIYEIENEETLSIYLYKLACIFLLLYNQVKIALKNGFF